MRSSLPSLLTSATATLPDGPVAGHGNEGYPMRSQCGTPPASASWPASPGTSPPTSAGLGNPHPASLTKHMTQQSNHTDLRIVRRHISRAVDCINADGYEALDTHPVGQGSVSA